MSKLLCLACWLGLVMLLSFPNNPTQSAISWHTSSVGGFSRSLPRSFPFFFSSLQDKVVSATLLPAFLLGALAIHDPWTNNPSTNQRNHGSASCTGAAVWFLGLGSYGPGLVFPCSDAAACNGWLKIYMQSAEDVIKERLQVEGQVKADVLALVWAGSKFNSCLFSESSHAGCKCIHRILRRF